MTSQIVNLSSRDAINQELAVSEYVNGLMDESQRRAFEEKLLDNKALQQALAAELQLRNLIVANHSEKTISEQAFDEFCKQIKPPQQHGYQLILGSLAAAILILVFAFQWFPSTPAGQFETLTNTHSTSLSLTAKANTGRYSVIFEPGLNPQAQSQLAKTFGFSIVAGPGAGNSYLVEFKQALSAEQLAQLRNHSQIVFFEPVAARAE